MSRKKDGFWRGVAATWKIAAGAALAIGAAQFLMRIAAPNVHDAWAAVRAPFIAVNVLYAWATILALLGVAQDRLNAPSPALRYLTGAVFFYYIAHQTITIVAGYHLTQLSLGPWPEFFLVSIITIVGCAAGYEIVKRIPVVRIFFGARAPLSPIAARAPQPA